MLYFTSFMRRHYFMQLLKDQSERWAFSFPVYYQYTYIISETQNCILLRKPAKMARVMIF